MRGTTHSGREVVDRRGGCTRYGYRETTLISRHFLRSLSVGNRKQRVPNQSHSHLITSVKIRLGISRSSTAAGKAFLCASLIFFFYNHIACVSL
ncbi:hypothetical protein FOBRF1_010729 [Fusarium oxysporum]